MGKILSSRDEPSSVETLQELVFIANEALQINEDPAEDEGELIGQLENGVIELCVKLDEQDVKISMLSMDLIQLSLQNATLMSDLRGALRVLEALGRPVNVDEDPFVRALSVMRREGDPEIVNRQSTENGIGVDVTLTFTEDKLAEALKLGIEDYINRTAAAAIRG